MVEEDWVDRGDGRSAGSDVLWPPFVSGYEEACGTRKEVVGCWGGADRSMWCSDGGGRRKERGVDRLVHWLKGLGESCRRWLCTRHLGWVQLLMVVEGQSGGEDGWEAG